MAAVTDGLPLHSRLLRKLNCDAPIDWSSCSIFKVSNYLRRISERAYEPQVVSIGPYHHGKDQLKEMEAYKMFRLKKLLDRTSESCLETYVTALEGMKEKAREFYSEPSNHIGGEEFVEMMLLDGCFVIELIRKRAMKKLKDENDKFFLHFTLRRVKCDMLLFDNQLPFFVLSELFYMTLKPTDVAKDFIDLAIAFFFEIIPGSCLKKEYIIMPGSRGRLENRNIKHLLDLFYDICCQASVDCGEVRISCSPGAVIRALCHGVMVGLDGMEEPDSKHASDPDSGPDEWQCIRSATELSEAGINFRKLDGNLFDVKFEKGVLSIPTLTIDDETVLSLQSLVVYEQRFKGASSKYFRDYVIFMDCLINIGKDVELLSHHGVIKNRLGDHESVATIFNKLGDLVVLDRDFAYASIFIKVEKHCNSKWNKWKANLWRTYFNTPWAGISFFAAVFLLLFTVLQSVFSVLDYLS